jgi:energy-coupling factor transport system ATP-binding protein
VKDEISYGLRNLGLSETEINSQTKEALSFVGLEGKEDSHPLNLGKGERQKLAVASILAMQPEVIIIDEPTTGLDWRGALQMMEMVKQLYQQGHTIILIGHDMNLVADYAHRVVVMGGGEVLADGSPQEVFGRAEILKKAFLKPPQIIQLAINLADLGFPNIIKVDDMEKEVIRRIGFHHDAVSQGGK